MKRLALLLLVGFCALQSVSAEDQPKPQPQAARRNAGVNRMVQRAQAGNPNIRRQQQRGPQVNRSYNQRVYSSSRVSNRTYVNRQYRPTSNGDFSNRRATVGNPERSNYSRNLNYSRSRSANVENNVHASRVWNGNRSGAGYRNWDRERRSRSYWRSHYDRFARFGGGYYYWNAGYWYPAYGYDPYFSSYVYDAPIYAYNDQDPGQVVADVQRALQSQGYNSGGVDGTYGPATRRALLDYQNDNGLEATGEIDSATLSALGLQ